MASKPPRKSRKMALCLAVSLVINAAFLTVLALKVFGQNTSMLKTNEPLVIEANNGDDNLYVLPRGTTLYYEKSYPEGFSRYRVYFNHKGVIAGDRVRMEPKYWGTLIDSLWLANIDADTLRDIFQRFPLSKTDVAAAVETNEITKADLAEMMRCIPD